ARTWRQHLFHRQARRHRRPFVPASRRADDRLDAAGLRGDDARRRPLGRRQSLARGRRQKIRGRQAQSQTQIENQISETEVRRWAESSKEWVRRRGPPLARRWTTEKPRSRIGSGSSQALKNRKLGCARPSPMSRSSSTTITPPRSRSK